MSDEIALVDLNRKTVVMVDGAVLPIVQFADDDGDDCEPLAATQCLAGRDGYGWLTIEIFPEPLTVN